MDCVSYNYDMVIKEGGTYDRWHRWSYGDPPVPVDLVGYTGVLQGRKKLTDELPLIELPSVLTPWVADTNSGIYILDDGVDASLKGRYRVYITNEITTGLCAMHKDIDGVYTLFLYNSVGEAVVCQSGKMTIKASAVQ